jgi:hypothetical protein
MPKPGKCAKCGGMETFLTDGKECGGMPGITYTVCKAFRYAHAHTGKRQRKKPQFVGK